MINFTNCSLEQISAHQVGNKTNGEELYLSQKPIYTDQHQEELLMQYFLKPFNNPEFYNLTFSNEDHTLNPLFNFAKRVFHAPDTLHENARNIAQHLYEVSEHPNIKAGDLFVAEISGIEFDGLLVEAVGIFKSENKHSFLQLERGTDSCSIKYDEGINIEKLDKGCLIINVDENQGYKVCIVDKVNKGEEAHYWKETFLQLKPCADEYHQTKDFLSVARQYVTKQIAEEFEVEQTDKIDLLNKSVDYFKKHEQFDKEEFEEEVFQQPELIESFQKFDQHYREEMEWEPADNNFDISQQAVKKQSNVFKSVLKLDRNFSIYIHGDKSLIQKGTETDGRKFYKIYFDEEK